MRLVIISGSFGAFEFSSLILGSKLVPTLASCAGWPSEVDGCINVDLSVFDDQLTVLAKSSRVVFFIKDVGLQRIAFKTTLEYAAGSMYIGAFGKS